MSVSASIDLRVRSDICPLVLVVIRRFLAFGWSFNYDGSVFFLPVGDNDDFDWHKDQISDENLLEILGEKEKLRELIGVTMTWKNTGIGGEFLFSSDGSISINLSINRKKIEQGFTDVNWYLSRIIPALAEGEIAIESLAFSEHV